MKRWTTRLAVVLGVMAWAAASAGESTARGRIAETGWGRFNLEEAGGLVRGFNLAMRDTAYEPASWRPAVGDEVTVEYTAVDRRGRTVLRVDKVVLVEAGPNTVQIESPVEIRIAEAGRTAVRGVVIGEDGEDGASIRFARARESRFIPEGWAPQPGERARLTFTTRAAPGGFAVVHVIETLERLAAAPEG